MKISNNLFSGLNIQMFIIFINIEYLIYNIYSIGEGYYFGQSDMIMLVSSAINLLISLVLYTKYLNNRLKIDRIISKKVAKTIDTQIFLNKVSKEMRYILANLLIFLIYSFCYFVYIIFIVNFSQ